MKNNLKFLKKSWLNVFLYCIVSYLCVTIERNGIINTQNFKIMTTQETNIANALFTAKEILTKMLAQGLGDAKHLFVVSNMLCETYNLTRDQSIIILEEALKIA